jgi:hypothetical protein
MPWTVDIDGSNITALCQSINWHPRWSRPATCVVKYPAHLFSCVEGQELHLYNPSGQLVFSGPVWQIQAEGDPDRTDAEITAFDHLIYMSKRLCKQRASDISPFNLIEIWPTIADAVTAPAIMAAFVQAALDDPRADGAAPLPWVIGSVDGGPDVTSVPKDTPKTLDSMRQDLLSTGQLAINVVPGVGSSVLNFIRPPQVTGSPIATFGYQTGAFNSQNATITSDMDEVINALWYLLGPRGPRPGIPINHWAGSITPTAANAGGDGKGRRVNGVFVDNPPQYWPPETVAKFMGSRGQYGYFQEIRIFDDNEDEQDIREEFEEMWNNEAWIRAYPRKFVGIKPERGVVPTFNVGDFVAMQAGSRLHGGISGVLEVFEFEVEINVNGICAITEIVASDDQSGAPSVGG